MRRRAARPPSAADRARRLALHAGLAIAAAAFEPVPVLVPAAANGAVAGAGAGAETGLPAGARVGAAAAQEAPPAGAAEWNARRTLELVERARSRRQEPALDTTLLNYRAEAQGHIYFLIDREGEEPVLIRADQVALELYWAPPDRVKQIIRGMRTEEQLPIRDFRYYLDRYTVIQNNFGDEIRVGEGRDVRDVPHPLAPGAEAVYDYRLVDSTTIRLPGEDQPLRVYEVQVRPDDFGAPAIVGSLFIERARADLVRLAFTFTPAAYLDRRNERVEVTLENALWEGRYWLPREQRLMVRRELPELDLDVGTVIRATLRVSHYDLNVDLPRGFFTGAPVVFAGGPERLEEYPFEEGLYAGLPEVGLADAEPGSLGAVDVHDIAGRILRQRYLRGVPRVRFHLPDVSSLLRYDRAEGLVTAAALSYGVRQNQLTGLGGYAWGAGHPVAEVALRPLSGSGGRWSAEAYLNRPMDLGLRPAAAGALSSLAAAFFGNDYRDLYFASGVGIGFRAGPLWGGDVTLRGHWERHASPDPLTAATHAPFNENAEFRPVLPIREGSELAVGARWITRRREGLGAFTFTYDVELGAFRSEPVLTAEVRSHRTWRGARLHWGVDVASVYRATLGGEIQHRRLMGGRNTLPGHPFHGYTGTNTGVIHLEGWREVVPRWLRVRGLGALGFSGDAGRIEASTPQPPGTEPWTLRHERGFLGSLGVGVGFIDGIVRLDYAWPLGGEADRRGTLILSIDPSFWPNL